jgi:polyhydroxyalkanoate synthase
LDSHINSFFRFQHAVLHRWQTFGDEASRQITTLPVFLEATGFWFNQFLNTSEFYFKSLQKFGFTPDAIQKFWQDLNDASPLSGKNVSKQIRRMEKAGMLPPVAQTPAEVVFSKNGMRLLRYRSQTPKKFAVPVLIVSSLVGKYYILDLTPGRSYVSFLLEKGFDVFIIDWGTTAENCKNLDLEDYIEGFLPEAVEATVKAAGSEKLSLLGYSMGGLLALIYTALAGEKVKNLMLLAAPVDMEKVETIKCWTDEKYFDVDRYVDLFGYVSADTVSAGFQMVKQASSAFRGLNLFFYGDDAEDFQSLLAMEMWLQDAAPLPGKLYRTMIRKFFRENQLVKTKLEVGGQKVDLMNVTCPVLTVAGEQDLVAPPESASALLDLIKSEDKEHLVLPYGHLTIAIGSGAREDFWRQSAEWFEAKQE